MFWPAFAWGKVGRFSSFQRAQVITAYNPVTYFMQLIRMVLLKGSEIQHVAKHFVVISVMAVTTLGVAVFTYRKRA